jgi:transposase
MRSRVYDKAFKLNAVLLHKGGKKWSEVCRELGIPDATLHGWVKQYEQEGEESFVGSGKVKPDSQEVIQLKKQLADARLERDILKKAIAIFSKQQP